jgi:hypothetical protein
VFVDESRNRRLRDAFARTSPARFIEQYEKSRR